MLTLKYNPVSYRYDLHSLKGKQMHNLACGSRCNLYLDDEGIFVAGRIEHHNTNGYYFICHEGYVTYLYNGMQGTLS